MKPTHIAPPAVTLLASAAAARFAKPSGKLWRVRKALDPLAVGFTNAGRSSFEAVRRNKLPLRDSICARVLSMHEWLLKNDKKVACKMQMKGIQ